MRLDKVINGQNKVINGHTFNYILINLQNPIFINLKNLFIKKTKSISMVAGFINFKADLEVSKIGFY